MSALSFSPSFSSVTFSALPARVAAHSVVQGGGPTRPSVSSQPKCRPIFFTLLSSARQLQSPPVDAAVAPATALTPYDAVVVADLATLAPIASFVAERFPPSLR